jgi:hypothetical protein
MGPNETGLSEPRAESGPALVASMRQGVLDALRDHKQAGRSIVTWDRESNLAVEIPAGEIVIPEDSRDGRVIQESESSI